MDNTELNNDRFSGILLFPDEVGELWTAQCLETGIQGQANTPQEAVENLESIRTTAN